MTKEHNGDTGAHPAAAEFSEALKEIQRGESTAQALENHLDSLEKKIEALLAQAEKADAGLETDPTPSSEKPTSNNNDKKSS